MTRRLFVSILTFALMIASPLVAWAGGATDIVKAKQSELFKLLDSKDADANKKIAGIFDDMLDYQALAEASLGSEWSSLKDDQKKEFVDLLKQLVKQAYERNLRKTLDYNIEYVGEESAGDKAFIVKTVAKHKTDTREDPISIDYKLVQQSNGKYKMVDIITEEVSLVSSYRSQFVKILKKDGYAGLSAKMKEKIAKGQ
ncbi:MAG: ABC transporter substrate-binding protein [Polyangiaceae bacterium]